MKKVFVPALATLMLATAVFAAKPVRNVNENRRK
jgi:hypothetical protein